MNLKFICAFMFMEAVGLFFSKPIYSQSKTEDMQLKAAYLYNFAKYIKWPNEFEQFVIGIYKDEKLQEAFYNTIKERKVTAKDIVFLEIEAPENLLQCHMIYLTSLNSMRLSSVIKTIKFNSILIVTEDDLIEKGAMISFAVINKKPRFKLKQSLCIKSGLIAREGLLKLAILE